MCDQCSDRPCPSSTGRLLRYTQSVPPTQTERKGVGTGNANLLNYQRRVCLAVGWGQMLLLWTGSAGFTARWTLAYANVRLVRIEDLKETEIAMTKTLKCAVFFLALTTTPLVFGQITSPRTPVSGKSGSASLEEQLINRLKATRDDQRAYVKHVVSLTKNGKLERKLVVAVERYAMRRNSKYPFPFFERALKYEAAKRRVQLPSVKNFASTRPSAPSAGNISP